MPLREDWLSLNRAIDVLALQDVLAWDKRVKPDHTQLLCKLWVNIQSSSHDLVLLAMWERCGLLADS